MNQQAMQVLTPSDDEADATTIHCVPVEVLLHTLSFLKDPADLRALCLTSKSMHTAATDCVLMANWLLAFQPCGQALRLAAEKRRQDVCIRLIQNMGVSATARTEFYGPPPLQLAAKHNLIGVARYLWTERSDVRSDVDAAADAMHTAAVRGHSEILELLLSSPSPLTANTKNMYCSFPLHSAAFSAQLSSVEVLLTFGASVTARCYGWCALHRACTGTTGSGENRARVVQRLLLAPDGMSVLNCQDNRGDSPLHCAAASGNAEVVSLLISVGADIHLRNFEGEGKGGGTPFQLARENSQVRGILMLALLKDARLNGRLNDDDGRLSDDDEGAQVNDQDGGHLNDEQVALPIKGLCVQ